MEWHAKLNALLILCIEINNYHGALDAQLISIHTVRTGVCAWVGVINLLV